METGVGKESGRQKRTNTEVGHISLSLTGGGTCCCLIPVLWQASWSRSIQRVKDLFHLIRYSSSSREVKARTQQRSHGGLLLPGVLKLLLSHLSYMPKNACPRNDTAHGGLCLPISVTNKDDTHRLSYGLLWSGQSCRLELMRTVSLWLPGAPWEPHWLSLNPSTSSWLSDL